MELTESAQFIEHLPFDLLDYIVISLNLIIFLFAGSVLGRSPRYKGNSADKIHLLGLRTINLALFTIYIIAGLSNYLFDIGVSHLQQISQTGLTILITYILLHYIQDWIVIRFGKEREIEGEKLLNASYASEMIGLIALILTSSIALLVIINIWNLNNWLQATSVLGGILLILFASKEYFLGDLINGLIMHYNPSVEAGSVIRVKEHNLLGVVIKITLSQTVIRDLVQKHEITIPNTKLRNSTVETISNNGVHGFRDFIDFNIGYDKPAEEVQQFLESVWEQSANDEASINIDAKPKIVVIENGDHAVTWRLLYYVQNAYRIADAHNMIQTVAFQSSQRHNMGLNTPVTHEILSTPLAQAKDISIN